MKAIKDFIVFFGWMIFNAKFDKDKNVWVATGFKSSLSCCIKKYGQILIFCPRRDSFEFFHELAHYELGHMNDIIKDRHLEYELQCDEFAANKIGMDNAISALKQLQQIAAEQKNSSAVVEYHSRIQYLS